jgi:hypothetical protein
MTSTISPPLVIYIVYKPLLKSSSWKARSKSSAGRSQPKVATAWPQRTWGNRWSTMEFRGTLFSDKPTLNSWKLGIYEENIMEPPGKIVGSFRGSLLSRHQSISYEQPRKNHTTRFLNGTIIGGRDWWLYNGLLRLLASEIFLNGTSSHDLPNVINLTHVMRLKTSQNHLCRWNDDIG